MDCLIYLVVECLCDMYNISADFYVYVICDVLYRGGLENEVFYNLMTYESWVFFPGRILGVSTSGMKLLGLLYHVGFSPLG